MIEVGTRVREIAGGHTGTVTAYTESYTSPSPLVRAFLASEQGTPHVQVEWDDGFDTWIEGINDHMWTPVRDFEEIQ